MTARVEKPADDAPGRRAHDARRARTEEEEMP